MTIEVYKPETEIAKLDPVGLSSYATELSQVEYQEPRIRFTRDELISIAEKVKSSAQGVTMQEFKTFINLSMLRGTHPLLNQCWLMKYKASDGGYYPAAYVTCYQWFEQEARHNRPDLMFTLPQWYDEKTGKWSEVWAHDPKTICPYQGKIGVKTVEMNDYTWVTLRWDERFKKNFKTGKPQAEWANQPIFMMTKCLWKLASEKFMPSFLQGVTTEVEYQRPVEREGTWVDDPNKSQIDNTIERGRVAKEREIEEKNIRKGDLSGKPTDDQRDEFRGLQEVIEPEVIKRILIKLGFKSIKGLSQADFESVLVELRKEGGGVPPQNASGQIDLTEDPDLNKV